MPCYPNAIAKAVTVSRVAAVKVAVEADVALPFASNVRTGIADADPYEPADTPEAARVNARDVVPDPVASPEAVIVWLAVKYVEVSISYVSLPVLLTSPVSESGISECMKAPAAFTLVASVMSAPVSIPSSLV